MIVWCDKYELRIISDINPLTSVRKPLPSDTKEEKKDKKLYPYLNKKQVKFEISYLGVTYHITIEKDFKWDGSSCPTLHHIPSLLNASMLHDMLCNDHSLVGFDRQLSSIVFREMGIASGVNKAFMYVAYHCVDNFQKVFGRDKQGRKWGNNELLQLMRKPKYNGMDKYVENEN